MNENEVKNVERLIKENVDENTILEVMNISKNTFLRIKAGKHFLQKKAGRQTRHNNRIAERTGAGVEVKR